ncbi:hypothetical protein Pst134EB_019999 [Puccinia striiformis f. sp. tritici]|uniref:Uncharacterized protein n=1 Tax=Puccinia striiformis f. sp. tritici PST-78 TaxID=1165861 RepID=A0A0L0VTJ0_9BASI|nr:hypothetical protein Pst134EB_019999 [Puccinia striiformis f. sp. tritici]KNF02517.1 hypothetical protein PSTG_04423 [Puccinia striiformis f. sp. tritici PST-78]
MNCYHVQLRTRSTNQVINVELAINIVQDSDDENSKAETHLKVCWNTSNGNSPRKRRTAEDSSIELLKNKRVVCGSRSNVIDVKEVIDQDQRSANSNLAIPNSNSLNLLDRISSPFIGSFENQQS